MKAKKDCGDLALALTIHNNRIAGYNGDMVNETVKMAALADTFKALSDETRLQIIALLLEREELCVCDIVGALDLTQSKVSRHLRYLFNAGLVEGQREGPWMHYRVSRHLSPDQKTVIAALTDAIGDDQRAASAQRLDQWFLRKNTE
jgi:ArsR family transcriptional regulator, arsenate/arsenite/antimonite-responsive transcriptional repressor